MFQHRPLDRDGTRAPIFKLTCGPPTSVFTGFPIAGGEKTHFRGPKATRPRNSPSSVFPSFPRTWQLGIAPRQGDKRIHHRAALPRINPQQSHPNPPGFFHTCIHADSPIHTLTRLGAWRQEALTFVRNSKTNTIETGIPFSPTPCRARGSFLPRSVFLRFRANPFKSPAPPFVFFSSSYLSAPRHHLQRTSSIRLINRRRVKQTRISNLSCVCLKSSFSCQPPRSI